jgi:hypothetical protein
MKTQVLKLTLILIVLVAIGVLYYGWTGDSAAPIVINSIDQIEDPPILEPVIPLYQHFVRVTGYNALAAQTDSTPNILADGTRIDIRNAGRYRYCALSRNLLKRWGGRYSFGDTIHLESYGHYVGPWIVKDVMDRRYVNYIDLLVNVGDVPKTHVAMATRIGGV